MAPSGEDAGGNGEEKEEEEGGKEGWRMWTFERRDWGSILNMGSAVGWV